MDSLATLAHWDPLLETLPQGLLVAERLREITSKELPRGPPGLPYLASPPERPKRSPDRRAPPHGILPV